MNKDDPPIRATDQKPATTADRLREFCAVQSIICPASTTGRRCSHSECAMYGCPYTARAA